MKFTIPGTPITKGRPRVVRKGKRVMTFTPQETVAYERKVRLCAMTEGIAKLDGPVSLRVVFYLPNRRPKDCDNLVKSVADGLNGVAYADDSQVCELWVQRRIDPTNPRAVVWVEPFEEPMERAG